MNDLERIREWVISYNPEALFADGFEDAIMGLAERCGQPTLIVYDTGKCLQILEERDKMTREEAVDYFNFNVTGAWMGENTPLFFTPIDL